MTDTTQWQTLTAATPLRVRVRDAIKDLIVNGVLQPGKHLAEVELAKRLGVSRNPVREGLQMLAHEGFVDLRPGRGAYVHAPTRREIEDVFDVRILLEREGARRAADRITPQALARLAEILTIGAAAVEVGEPLRLLELNAQFHGIITAASGNTTMANLNTLLSRQIRWQLASVVVARAPGSWSEHEGIYQALLARDSEESARLMAEHIGTTRSRLREQSDPMTSPSLAPGPGPGPGRVPSSPDNRAAPASRKETPCPPSNGRQPMKVGSTPFSTFGSPPWSPITLRIEAWARAKLASER